MIARMIVETNVSRGAVAGGDTSGAVTDALAIRALRMHAAITPGAPLCGGLQTIDGGDILEIVLKGGQIGAEDYFGSVRRGGA